MRRDSLVSPLPKGGISAPLDAHSEPLELLSVMRSFDNTDRRISYIVTKDFVVKVIHRFIFIYLFGWAVPVGLERSSDHTPRSGTKLLEENAL